ncbi:MAG TPA: CDP-alcohol phosphatidyltransferase family protein [Ignavibacteria bacterium]|jgi:CDP-diacylglycerol--glycerol-3-phosphate 3-phosphatidyltransferase
MLKADADRAVNQDSTLNLPNTLSLLRIILAPIFLYLFLSDSKTAVFLAFIVYTFAALTDWYDGWYARRYGYKTKWGQFIDPLADKILTSSAFIGFYLLKQKNPAFLGAFEPVPIWILIGIIILRDITLTIARSVRELRGKEFRTSVISKSKTFIQMVFIFIIIGCLSFGTFFSSSDIGYFMLRYLQSSLNYYILFFISLLTAASGIAYIFEKKG